MTPPAANLGSRTPWFQVWDRVTWTEGHCERCNYTGSATKGTKEERESALAREAVWHERCQER